MRGKKLITLSVLILSLSLTLNVRAEETDDTSHLEIPEDSQVTSGADEENLGEVDTSMFKTENLMDSLPSNQISARTLMVGAQTSSVDGTGENEEVPESLSGSKPFYGTASAFRIGVGNIKSTTGATSLEENYASYTSIINYVTIDDTQAYFILPTNNDSSGVGTYLTNSSMGYGALKVGGTNVTNAKGYRGIAKFILNSTSAKEATTYKNNGYDWLLTTYGGTSKTLEQTKSGVVGAIYSGTYKESLNGASNAEIKTQILTNIRNMYLQYYKSTATGFTVNDANNNILIINSLKADSTEYATKHGEAIYTRFYNWAYSTGRTVPKASINTTYDNYVKTYLEGDDAQINSSSLTDDQKAISYMGALFQMAKVYGDSTGNSIFLTLAFNTLTGADTTQTLIIENMFGIHIANPSSSSVAYENYDVSKAWIKNKFGIGLEKSGNKYSYAKNKAVLAVYCTIPQYFQMVTGGFVRVSDYTNYSTIASQLDNNNKLDEEQVLLTATGSLGAINTKGEITKDDIIDKQSIFAMTRNIIAYHKDNPHDTKLPYATFINDYAKINFSVAGSTVSYKVTTTSTDTGLTEDGFKTVLGIKKIVPVLEESEESSTKTTPLTFIEAQSLYGRAMSLDDQNPFFAATADLFGSYVLYDNAATRVGNSVTQTTVLTSNAYLNRDTAKINKAINGQYTAANANLFSSFGGTISVKYAVYKDGIQITKDTSGVLGTYFKKYLTDTSAGGFSESYRVQLEKLMQEAIADREEYETTDAEWEPLFKKSITATNNYVNWWKMWSDNSVVGQYSSTVSKGASDQSQPYNTFLIERGGVYQPKGADTDEQKLKVSKINRFDTYSRFWGITLTSKTGMYGYALLNNTASLLPTFNFSYTYKLKHLATGASTSALAVNNDNSDLKTYGYISNDAWAKTDTLYDFQIRLKTDDGSGSKVTATVKNSNPARSVSYQENSSFGNVMNTVTSIKACGGNVDDTKNEKLLYYYNLDVRRKESSTYGLSAQTLTSRLPYNKIYYTVLDPNSNTFTGYKEGLNITNPTDKADQYKLTLGDIANLDCNLTNSGYSLTTPEFKSGIIYPDETITTSYNVDLSIGKKTTELVAGEDKTCPNTNDSLSVQITRKSDNKQTIDTTEQVETNGLSWAELKQTTAKATSVNNLLFGQETWEAQQGTPTTENLYYAVGGEEFMVDVTFSSKYYQDVGGVKADILSIDSYTVYQLSGGQLSGAKVIAQSETYTASDKNSGIKVLYNGSAQKIGATIVSPYLVLFTTQGYIPVVYHSYTTSGNYNTDRANYGTVMNESGLLLTNTTLLGVSPGLSTGNTGTTKARNTSNVIMPQMGYNGKAADLDSSTQYATKYTNINTTKESLNVPIYSVNSPPTGVPSQTVTASLVSISTLVTPTIETMNGVYGRDTKFVSSLVYTSTSGGSKKVKTAYTPATKAEGYQVNDIVIHNPVSIKITDVDDTVEESNDLDQRKSGATYSFATNKIFVDRQFTMTVSTVHDFTNDTTVDTYGVNKSNENRGIGFTNSLNTIQWISRATVKFPFGVELSDGSYQEAGTTINLPLTEEHKVAGQEGVYTFTYKIPLKTEEYSFFGNRIKGGSLQSSSIQTQVFSINPDATDDVNINQTVNDSLSTSVIPSTVIKSLGLERNRMRDYNASKLAAYDNAISLRDVDIVGHIGGLTMLDTGDFRFSNFFKTPLDPIQWLYTNLIKKVDVSKQNNLLVDKVPTNRLELSNGNLNTYGTQTYKEDSSKMYNLPLVPFVNNIDSLRNQPLRLGYAQYLSLETIGNYYGETTGSYNGGQSLVELRPRYYHVTADGNTVTPVDAWVNDNGTYKLINDNNAPKTTFEWLYKLDWANENSRRMFTSLEQSATTASAVTAPIESGTVNTGTTNHLYLTSVARTYIGTQDSNGTLKQSQRYHLTLGLPSSTVFIPSSVSSPITENGYAKNPVFDVNSVITGGYVVCALEAVSVGDTWVLQYDNKTVLDKLSSRVNVTPDLTLSKTALTNAIGEGIPVAIISIDKSAKDDISMKGTH